MDHFQIIQTPGRAVAQVKGCNNSVENPHYPNHDGIQRQSPRILVVESDIGTRQLLIDYLGQRGMQAVAASEWREIASHLAQTEPSLVILGLRLVQADGFDLLRKIRSRFDIPIIVTTSDQSDEVDDGVVALELGADDHLTKPLHLQELVARIRAILRRRERPTALRRTHHDRIRFGNWELDRRTRLLVKAVAAPVKLTKGEYAILTAFLAAPGRPLSREYLLRATRMHEDICDRSIDVIVLRLRQKVEIDPAAPTIIRTERGVGYVFTQPVEVLP